MEAETVVVEGGLDWRLLEVPEELAAFVNGGTTTIDQTPKLGWSTTTIIVAIVIGPT